VGNVLRGMNFNPLRRMSDKADSGRVMGVREITAKLMEKYSEYDQNMMKKFLGLVTKKKGYDDLAKLMEEKSTTYFALELMKKFGKTDAQHLYNLYDNVKKSTIINRVKTYAPESITSDKEIGNFLAATVKNINSWDKDIHVAFEIVQMSHNYASEIDKDTLISLTKAPNASSLVVQKKDEYGNTMWHDGPDIIDKFFTLVLKIMGQGGYKNILTNNAEGIRILTERGALEPGLEERIQDLADIFRQGIKINSRKKNFMEIKSLITELSSDIDLIIEYSSFKKYYNEAEKNTKNENLFKLDMSINKNIRFRVLRDLDAKYFKVGKETDCCQHSGGEGKNAMVDSFINPWAGVLVLEHNREDEGWTTVAQSYFHYVPPGVTEGEVGDYEVKEEEDEEVQDIIDSFAADDENADKLKKGGYILDNIEVNPEYDDEVEGIRIAEIYAYWAAAKLKEIPEIGYIQAGAGQSDVNTAMFGGIIMDHDPRNFYVSDPYTDWDAGQVNMDLSEPDFKFKQLPDLRTDTEYEKLAALAAEFYRMTV
jgi:hypothetical protein